MTGICNYKRKKMVAFFYKMFCILLLLFIIVIEGLFLCFIFRDPFRFYFLFSKHILKFIFLLLTGFFLYCLNYQIIGMRVSFNAFIIYISNNLLKDFNMKGLEIVYFFVFVYFVLTFMYQCFCLRHNLTRRSIFNIIYGTLTSVMMWLFLITTYNFLIEKFNISFSQLHVIDTLFFFVIILVHHIQKTLFVFLNLKLEHKYYNFYYHSVPYLLSDSIFIYFSMILGSVYQSIGILNMSFFIIFLAFAFLIIKIISENIASSARFYSICSFIDSDFFQNNKNYFDVPQMIGKKYDFLNEELPDSVLVIAVTPDSADKNFVFDGEIPINKRFFLYRKKFFCSVLKSKDEINSTILAFEDFFHGNVRFSFCTISADKLRRLPIDYIFSILIHKLKLKRRIKENMIVVSNNYIAL